VGSGLGQPERRDDRGHPRQSADDQSLQGRAAGRGPVFPGRLEDGEDPLECAKKSAEAPAPTLVPDTLHDVDFMARDSKRFGSIGNWGYAQFNYNNASATFTPVGTGAECGVACHTIVAKKDYVFTAYPKR